MRIALNKSLLNSPHQRGLPPTDAVEPAFPTWKKRRGDRCHPFYRDSRALRQREFSNPCGYLSLGLSANLAPTERYPRCAIQGKQVARGYPQGLTLHTRLVIPAGVEPAFPT